MEHLDIFPLMIIVFAAAVGAGAGIMEGGKKWG